MFSNEPMAKIDGICARLWSKKHQFCLHDSVDKSVWQCYDE